MSTLNEPRTGMILSVLAKGALAALLGMTIGCGASSPAGPAPMPVTPAPAPIAVANVALTASPSLVTSGDRLTVSWVGPNGRGCNGGGDWIAIYKVGDPDFTGAANGHSDLWYEHLCGAASGTFTLRAPSQPGQYEFRYMEGGGSVARSNPVTVS